MKDDKKLILSFKIYTKKSKEEREKV